MYQNSNMWDRLRVCAVGRSWPAEFYHWIDDPAVRSTMQQIANETEEDYQTLINCLNNLDVKVIRPCINIETNHPDVSQQMLQSRPPMCPGDDLIMLGNTLITSFTGSGQNFNHYSNIISHVASQGNSVACTQFSSINGASVYQFSDQILFALGAVNEIDTIDSLQLTIKNTSQVSKVSRLHNCGHIDGWFTPVTPGLIISGADHERPKLLKLFFDTYFPGWEIVTLPPTLTEFHKFEKWQKRHCGKWWVPGQEHNYKFVEFVNDYLTNWVGNVQETIFDLNMIVVDQHNVVVSHYNKRVFDALTRHNVTPHLVKLRHANFWDGGVHCVITELHRQN